MRLSFGAAMAGDIFQHKIDENFKELTNVLGIADNIGNDADGKGHDRTLKLAMQKCCKENHKLNKDKCHFRSGEIISRRGVQPDPCRLCTPYWYPSPTNKNSCSNS